MSSAELTVFCVTCLAVGEPNGIIITATDTLMTCPVCHRHYGLATRQLTSVHTSRNRKTGWVRYLLETVDGNKARRLRRIEAQDGIRLTPGSLATFVWKGRHLVGVSDHNRGLWFNIVSKPPAFPELIKFYDFLALVLLLCVLLQVARWLPVLKDQYTQYGPGLFLVVAFLAALAVSLPRLTSLLSQQIAIRSYQKRSQSQLPEFDTTLDD